MVTDSHRVLARWRNHFCHLFVAHGLSDVRQTEEHTAESLVFDSRALEFDTVIEMVKTNK